MTPEVKELVAMLLALLIVLIGAFGGGYLLVAAIEWRWNPAVWSIEARGVWMALGVLMVGFWYGVMRRGR